jgi:hypothetical protein
MLSALVLDSDATEQLTDEAAHALRQALLPLALAARRRLEKLDPHAPNAAFVVRDVQQTEAALAAVSAYHFAAMGERELASYNIRQLIRALTPSPSLAPDWEALTFRLFACFPIERPPSPLEARLRASRAFQDAQARTLWPQEQRQATALISSHRLPPVVLDAQP